MKSPYDDDNFLSEVTSNRMKKVTQNINLNTGYSGTAFTTKKLVFEPNCKDKEYQNYPMPVSNVIAVPIFDSQNNSIGVFEIINSDNSVFTLPWITPLLNKFAKYISLVFYTNSLLKVLFNIK